MPPPTKRATRARDASKGVAVAIAAVQGKYSRNAAQLPQPDQPRKAARRPKTKDNLTARSGSDAAAAGTGSDAAAADTESDAAAADTLSDTASSATGVVDGDMVASKTIRVIVAAPSDGQQTAEQCKITHGGDTAAFKTRTPRSPEEVNAANTCK